MLKRKTFIWLGVGLYAIITLVWAVLKIIADIVYGNGADVIMSDVLGSFGWPYAITDSEWWMIPSVIILILLFLGLFQPWRWFGYPGETPTEHVDRRWRQKYLLIIHIATWIPLEAIGLWQMFKGRLFHCASGDMGWGCAFWSVWFLVWSLLSVLCLIALSPVIRSAQKKGRQTASRVALILCALGMIVNGVIFIYFGFIGR